MPADQFRGLFCDLVGVAIQASDVRSTSGRVSCSLYLLTPAQTVCRIFMQQMLNTSQLEAEPRLNQIRSCWNELAQKALVAAKCARQLRPVAVQNVVFEKHANGMAYFSSTQLQIQISSSPCDVRLRQILDLSFISPADLLKAYDSNKAGH